MAPTITFDFDGLCRLGANGQSTTLTIRRPYLQALKLKSGDTVLVRIVDGALVIRPMRELLEQVAHQLKDRDRLAVQQALP